MTDFHWCCLLPRICALAASFAYITGRREFRESRNMYMRELQTRVFYANSIPEFLALAAKDF